MRTTILVAASSLRQTTSGLVQLVRSLRVSSLLALSLAGCTGYRTVYPAPSLDAQRIRVRFAPARALSMVRANGDPVAYDRVHELTGRAVTVTADSIKLSVWAALTDLRSDLHVPTGSVVTIARADAASIERWTIDERRSAAVIFVIAAGAVVSLGFFLLILSSLDT